VLDEVDKVKEALCLLMMANQGLAKTVCTVRKDVFKRVEGGGIAKMEWLFMNVGAQQG